MEENAKGFAERLKGLSDEELKNMLETGLREYTEEALAAAREELEGRGKHGEVKAVPALRISETPVPDAAAPAAKKRSLWGAILVVAGAFFIYNTVLFSALAIVRSNAGIRVPTELVFQILFSLVLAFICLRAGSRRKRRWETLVGICLLIFGGLAFMSLSVLAKRPNTLVGKVMVPTVIILALAGIVSLLFGYIRRTYNK